MQTALDLWDDLLTQGHKITGVSGSDSKGVEPSQAERLRGTALRLHSLSPLLTIARGYAVVRHDSDNAIITSIHQAQHGDALTIQVTDGHIPVEVR